MVENHLRWSWFFRFLSQNFAFEQECADFLHPLYINEWNKIQYCGKRSDEDRKLKGNARLFMLAIFTAQDNKVVPVLR